MRPFLLSFTLILCPELAGSLAPHGVYPIIIMSHPVSSSKLLFCELPYFSTAVMDNLASLRTLRSILTSFDLHQIQRDISMMLTCTNGSPIILASLSSGIPNRHSQPCKCTNLAALSSH